MLALDSTIGCIEATETEVLELFRSPPVTKISSPGSRPEIMEAHVCAIKKKTLVKVYLAFVINDRKIYVYTAGKGTSEADYARDLEEALESARAMGFSPERVDLSYSPAMREVVVRNSKILRLPGTKGAAALKHGQPGAPTLPISPKAPLKEVLLPEPSPLPSFTPAVQASGQDVAEPLKQTQPESAKVHKALLAERDALATQLQQLSLRHEQDAAELSAALEASAALKAEKEALQRQAEQAKKELRAKEAQAAKALTDAANLATRLDAVEQKQARTEEEHEAMTESLARARQDLTKLSEEYEEARESERKAGIRQLETAAQLEEARQQLELLRADREQASQRLTDLTQEKERLEQGLAALQRDAIDVEAAKKTASHDKQKVPAESELAELRQELAKVVSEKNELLQRVNVLEERKASTETELTELRQERERLAEKKDDALRQHPLPLPPNPAFGEASNTFEEFDVPNKETHDWSEPHPAAKGADVEFPPPDQDVPFFPPLGDLTLGGFASGSDDGPAVRFMLESRLAAIEVRSAEDVLELQQSINNAYLSPEGTGGQESCQGYICCLRNGDAKEVFAAIYGTQSKRTMVYLPEEQPSDDESYARTVRGAVCFAEEVGLMMEPVLLDASAAKRRERLKRCPALHVEEHPKS